MNRAKLWGWTIAATILMLASAGGLASAEIVRPDAKEIVCDARFYLEGPHAAEVGADGVVRIEWRTKIPSPPGALYFGADDPSQTLAEPRFREKALESKDGGDRELHSVEIDLKKLMTGKADLGGWRASDFGVVRIRVENHDPENQRGRLQDARFCFYRNEKDGFAPAPCVVLGPFVANVTHDGAVIWFETDATAKAVVYASNEGGEALRFESGSGDLRHEFKLDGLKPGQSYRYYVELDAGGAGKAVFPAYQFKTVPEPGAEGLKYRFAVFSDSRSAPGGPLQNMDSVNVLALRTLMREAYWRGADFILFPGDMIDGYTTALEDYRSQMRAWYRAVEPVGHYIPVYIAMGNHDTLQQWFDDSVFSDGIDGVYSEGAFAQMVVNPVANLPAPEFEGGPPYDETVYSFRYGSSSITAVNTYYWYTKHPDVAGENRGGNIMPNQLRWIDAELERVREEGAKRVFVFGHSPPYPNGGHVEDAMWYKGEIPAVNEMRTSYWGSMSRHGATAMFCAHEHNYSRTLIDASFDESYVNPVWQIISGGAGASMYKTVPWKDKVAAFSAQESFTLIEVDEAADKVFLKTVSSTGQTIDEAEL